MIYIGVNFILVRKDRKILIQLKNDNIWSFPGNAQESCETILKEILEKIKEETNFILENHNCKSSIDFHYFKEGISIYNRFFIYYIDDLKRDKYWVTWKEIINKSLSIDDKKTGEISILRTRVL